MILLNELRTLARDSKSIRICTDSKVYVSINCFSKLLFCLLNKYTCQLSTAMSLSKTEKKLSTAISVNTYRWIQIYNTIKDCLHQISPCLRSLETQLTISPKKTQLTKRHRQTNKQEKANHMPINSHKLIIIKK